MRKKQIYLVRFATLTLLTAAFAWNICQCKMISITAAGPSAVNCANAKTGPLLPPDPWESNLAKTGPLLPPDPWESNFAKTGPLLPPDPWQRGGGSLDISSRQLAARSSSSRRPNIADL